MPAPAAFVIGNDHKKPTAWTSNNPVGTDGSAINTFKAPLDADAMTLYASLGYAVISHS
jgi:hypothetical protein